ncbi:hypothetical protein Btru_024695 [Bulinus truncatus]|nr:hypothetical protein Btru_024695 [Bulinus truncatus]
MILSLVTYEQVDIVNFTTSWRDGLAFNALIHHYRPDLFNYKHLLGKDNLHRLNHAFSVANDRLGIDKLLDAEDMNVDIPDKKSVMTYLMCMFQVLPHSIVSSRGINNNNNNGGVSDVVLSPSSSKRFTAEVDIGQVRDKGMDISESAMSMSSSESRHSTMSTVSVDLLSYQDALENVLTWLLDAEEVIEKLEPISGEVTKVKEQFNEHEEFMVELTRHQDGIGGVLKEGNDLLTSGKVTSEEEKEIRTQMGLLNNRWEDLRVKALDRQSRNLLGHRDPPRNQLGLRNPPRNQLDLHNPPRNQLDLHNPPRNQLGLHNPPRNQLGLRNPPRNQLDLHNPPRNQLDLHNPPRNQLGLRNPPRNQLGLRNPPRNQLGLRNPPRNQLGLRNPPRNQLGLCNPPRNQIGHRNPPRNQLGLRNPPRNQYTLQPTKKSVRPSQPTKKSVRPSQPTKKSVGPSQPTKKSVRPSQPTKKSVRPSQPTKKSVRPSQPTKKSVRTSQPTKKSVRTLQPTKKSVRPSQPTKKSVRPSQPTKKTIGQVDIVEINVEVGTMCWFYRSQSLLFWRRPRLQKVLMDLQQGQLDDLANWLTAMESRIEKQQVVGADLDAIKTQVEEHKAIQKSLEEQQKKVDSLQNMVVVVDDNNTESACAAMEKQLESLGKRWAHICHWTEQQWLVLQELLMRWQQFSDEQSKFNDWLTEKEGILLDMKATELKTAEQVINQVKCLKSIENDMVEQVRRFDALNECGQQIVSVVDNQEAITKISTMLEEFQERWEKLVQDMESQSKEIASSGVELSKVSDFYEEETIEAETVQSTTAAPKKRRMESASKSEFDLELKGLLDWMDRTESTLHLLVSENPQEPFTVEEQRVLILVQKLSSSVL